MKLIKMSLVAALLVGSSAFAVENIKVSGKADLFYHTGGADADHEQLDLFDKDSSAADAALHIDITADLTKNVSAGLGYSILSTLGLENNLVSGVWGTSHGATASTGASYASALGGAKVEDSSWMNEAWIAATLGNTTAKLGRMSLDTPLAYTETWSVEKNTFESIVAINTDLPDTTVVAAFVGNGNGNETFGQDVNGTVAALGLATGGVINQNGDFTTFGTDGAYTVGVINNSYAPLTAQLWYYNVSKLATATWLQADFNFDGIKFGVQHSGIDYGVKSGADGVSSDVFAVMLGYEIEHTLHAKLAYSSVGEDAGAGFNTATASGGSKLYSEAWWSYGYVTAADTNAITFDIEYEAHGIGDFGFFFTDADNGHDDSHDMTEFTLTASKTYGGLDTTIAFINEKVGSHDAVNMAQVYLTYNY